MPLWRQFSKIQWRITFNKWELRLAGDYVLTTNGVVATSYHTIELSHDLRDGCLVAANDDNKVFPVTEILVANRYSDVCVLRVKGEGFTALPFNKFIPEIRSIVLAPR